MVLSRQASASPGNLMRSRVAKTRGSFFRRTYTERKSGPSSPTTISYEPSLHEATITADVESTPYWEYRSELVETTDWSSSPDRSSTNPATAMESTGDSSGTVITHGPFERRTMMFP